MPLIGSGQAAACPDFLEFEYDILGNAFTMCYTASSSGKGIAQ